MSPPEILLFTWWKLLEFFIKKTPPGWKKYSALLFLFFSVTKIVEWLNDEFKKEAYTHNTY